jgi:hypothetical protein
MPLLAVLSLWTVLTLHYKSFSSTVFCILNEADPCLYPSQFDTLYPGGNIPLSVHLLHAFPWIENWYVPLLELGFLTCDSCFLFCIIAFICLSKNKKRQAGREYYLVSATIVLPLNIAQIYLSPFIIIILGLAWPYEAELITKSSLPTGYSFIPYRELH